MFVGQSAEPQKSNTGGGGFEYKGVQVTYDANVNEFCCSLCTYRSKQRDLVKHHVGRMHAEGKT